MQEPGLAHDPPLVALATPWGRSALAVVRLSGAHAHEVVRRVARPLRSAPLRPGRPRRVAYADARGAFDDGIAWLQAGPSTYTGEDTAELTVHGNPLIVQRLLDGLVEAGAAPAGPGAFTRRAYLHGRMDLIRAEAVEQTIAATTPRGLAAARRALDGALGDQIAGFRDQVVEGIAELEARLDVPGDETVELSDAALEASLRQVAEQARALADTARAGHHLVHGARVALVGAVNAGKSSLLNALLGRPRALVSATPGTTRDVLEIPDRAAGLAVTWLDTAGERPTTDPIEAAGLALAKELVADADLLLVVLRATPEGLGPTERAILDRTADRPRLVVLNGIDARHVAIPGVDVRTSAATGEGIERLKHAVRAALVGELPADAVPAVASLHQARSLRGLAASIDEALVGWRAAGVVVAAECLHDGVAIVDGLTGADTREDVLDAMFARFCVGK